MNALRIYNHLIEIIRAYHPSQDLYIVGKAFEIAQSAHEGQYRKSGEAYIIHPLSVAVILAELGLDLESIAAGILHDIIEDTQYGYTDIAEVFTHEVAQIVDGVTKLEKIEYKKEQDDKNHDEAMKQLAEHQEKRVRESKKRYQEEKEREREETDLKERLARSEELKAENYRKMFLAMAKDIRVIVIKIADRLHNMRTLQFMTPEKQKKIAQETLDIYAPLAHRLGISKIWHELEDLSFRYLDPDAYYDLAEKIKRKQSDRVEFVENIINHLQEKLKENNINGIVEGRPKHFFSIYKKMLSKNITIDQMYDLFAVRVIVTTLMECYEVLGLAHDIYKPIQGRLKDYISMPKPNMYQSLHTTLIGPEGEPFELQIRTQEMHRTSEYGIAAHWKYKSGAGGVVKPESEEEKLNWLRQILEWQRDLSDNRQYLTELKTELSVFQDHVYCFTPKGEVASLPTGSNPIDFAYSIHSAVGNNMIGARVNGSIVSFDYQLKTGDRVEIITSRNSSGPKQEWLKYVKTSQARNKINQWFKKENKEENIQKGKDLLEYEIKRKNFDINILLTDQRKKVVLNKYNFKTMEALYASIGHGGIKEGQIVNRLIDDYNKEQEHLKRLELERTTIGNANLEEILGVESDDSTKHKSKKKSGITVQGVGDLSVRFSKCCSPVPGDEIVGFTTRGRGVSIHRTDCTNIIHLPLSEKHRLIEAEWSMTGFSDNVKYRADLSIICEDRIGLIIDISKVFSDSKIPVKNLNARTINNEAFFNVVIEIGSRDQLDRVCQKILGISGVGEIKRLTT